MDAAAREKALLDGRQLLAQRRLEEALLVSTELTLACPDHAEVFAFHGDVLDELGKTPEAVMAYERALVLAPDSALDRIRLDQLRGKLDAEIDPLTAAPTDRRRRALNYAALAAGVVLVGSALASIWLSRPANAEPLASSVVGERVLESQPFYPPAPVPADSVNVQQPTGNNVTTTDPNLPENVTTTPGEIRVSPVIPGGGDSRPGENSQPRDDGFRPLSPTLVPENTTSGAATTHTDPNDSNANDTPPEANEPEDRGIVQISPSQGNGSVGNSQATGQGNGAASNATQLFNDGRDAQSRRDYATAARYYEQALRAGLVTGSVYQRLGQCYQNLNRKSEAIRAYEQAIAAYRRQSGGNDSVRERDIAACEDAIRRLRG